MFFYCLITTVLNLLSYMCSTRIQNSAYDPHSKPSESNMLARRRRTLESKRSMQYPEAMPTRESIAARQRDPIKEIVALHVSPCWIRVSVVENRDQSYILHWKEKKYIFFIFFKKKVFFYKWLFLFFYYLSHFIYFMCCTEMVLVCDGLLLLHFSFGYFICNFLVPF